MTCDRTLAYAIPEATAQAAHRAFPKGNLYLTLRDLIGPIFSNPDFADLYHTRGRPAEAPARLALVLALKEIEQYSDAQAAEAVRARIDWKYALALELDDPGFDASILPDFRTRLLAHGAEERLSTLLLDTLLDAGLLKARTRQRSDSTHVLANIRSLTRLTLVAETLRHALNDLATVAPDWLRSQIAPIGARPAIGDHALGEPRGCRATHPLQERRRARPTALRGGPQGQARRVHPLRAAA